MHEQLFCLFPMILKSEDEDINSIINMNMLKQK